MQLFPNTWRGWLWSVVRIGLGFYVLVLLLLYFAQERLIFHPSKIAPDFKFQFRIPFEEKILEVDGLKVHSLLFRPEDSRGLIVYFHGNAGSLDGWGDMAEELASRTRTSVWIVDYPGFGKSEGSITSEAQLHEVARALMDAALIETKGSTDQILIYGRSIGAGLAVKLAADVEPKLLILETPYMSLTSLAKMVFPWVPSSLLRYKFPIDQWILNVKCPIYIIHGDADEVIPYEQGRRLAELSHANFTTVVGGHHNNLGSHRQYWDFIDMALENAFGPK
jgi:pimeloyl-ACP methyl ester carboxylesterase